MHMPATTDTAMAAVPVDLAGKASAVNNAGRQLGGTLGIAILGSFAAAVYASGTREGLAGAPLDAATVDALASGIGAALQQVLPALEPAAAALAHTAVTEAFVDSITNTMRFGIIFAVLSGVVGWVLVPRRQRAAQVTSLTGPTADEAAQEALQAAAAPANGALSAPAPAPAPISAGIALHRPQKRGIEAFFD